MSASVHETEQLLYSILLQLTVMIGAARVMNTALRRVGQPGVIGEILAGLMLGPSLFGYFFPELSASVFGTGASQPITIISQLGLILLMFQIGTDFEFGHLKSKRNSMAVGAIAATSIAVPLALGVWFGLASAATLAPGVDAYTYAAFCGVGLAVTAVPILGRILREYGLTRTEVGVVAISAAAINDVVGWVLLAALSAYASAQLSTTATLAQVGGLVAFVAALWFVGRPLAAAMVRVSPPRDGELSPNLMATVICLLLVLGMCTFKLGIFAIFGGFAAGLLFHTFPEFVEAWRRQVGQFVLVFFLPVFFAYTGLRTNILGLSTASDLQWLLLALAAAVLGKIVPVYVGARVCGFTRYESATLGTLMNTRALMELIVLNIGFDLGFLPAKVFTMLVIMAVATTLMAGPLLKLLLPRMGHEIPVGVEA